jgi:hypothetical protein
MSRRSFGHETYEVVTGWDRPLHYHFLDIYQRDHPERDPIFSHLSLLNPSMTLEQIADTLKTYGITAPPTLFTDLNEDALADRGDFEVHYDPETGTASMQAEYGDRPDLGDASAAEPVERHRLQQLADRIREWFQRDRDRGMEL